MIITITELRNHFEKYLALTETETIYITKRGKIISKLFSTIEAKLSLVHELYGSVPNDGKSGKEICAE